MLADPFSETLCMSGAQSGVGQICKVLADSAGLTVLYTKE
jgi:hypothetical protein